MPCQVCFLAAHYYEPVTVATKIRIIPPIMVGLQSCMMPLRHDNASSALFEIHRQHRAMALNCVTKGKWLQGASTH